MLDFSAEMAQTEQEFAQKKPINFGPVPSGSIVQCKLEVIKNKPEKSDPSNPFIFVAGTGLRMIQMQFTVIRGEYDTVSWRQFVSLPSSMQQIQLTDGQATGCRMGGAMLKAICQAAGRAPQIPDVTALNGIIVPIKVRIAKKANEYTDRKGQFHKRWVNEVASIVTPDNAQYQEAMTKGEIINPNGYVDWDESGQSAFTQPNVQQTPMQQPMPQMQQQVQGWPTPVQPNIASTGDVVPF